MVVQSLLEGPRGHSIQSIQALQALWEQRFGSRRSPHLQKVPGVNKISKSTPKKYFVTDPYGGELEVEPNDEETGDVLISVRPDGNEETEWECVVLSREQFYEMISSVQSWS